MNKSIMLYGLGVALTLIFFSSAVKAADSFDRSTENDNTTTENITSKQSPWLIVPLVTSNPKLDTAGGLMVGYLHQFDEESRTSLFSISAKYSSSESTIANLFAKTSFGADHHRIVGVLVYADINNDYGNYLSINNSLGSNDNLRAAFLRYLYRVKGDWFVGGMVAYNDYQLQGQDELSDHILSELGLSGFASGGLGLVIMHDSRDSEFKPTNGWYLNINNLAYLEELGGEEDFAISRLDYRGYWTHGDGHVLAVRNRHQFSHNAPSSSFSPIYLRGYTLGENMAQYMSSVEIEERFKLADSWTMTAFAGVACHYGDEPWGGDSLRCTDSENVYPAWGAGIQYLLKPEEGIVANLEYAMGKDGYSGVYLKMGYSF